MRRWLVWSLGLVVALAPAATAEDAGLVKKQIQADYAKAMAALKHHDLKGFLTIKTDDYKGVEGGRTLTRTDQETAMQSYTSDSTRIDSYRYDIQNLKVADNKATGKATFRLDSTVNDSYGMFGAKGQPHRMRFEQAFATTYTRTGGAWKISEEVEAGQPRMWLDGKPFNPQAPPATTNKAAH